MAVVVSTDGTGDLLPAAAGQALLHLEFGSGPSGVPGGVYEVRYSSTLGDPPVDVVFVAGNKETRPATLPGLVGLGGPRYLRGDLTNNGEIEVVDAIAVLRYLFIGDFDPTCLEAANVNGSRQINITDPVVLLSWKFIGGVTIPPPFPECDFAPAPLGCERSGCEEPSPAGP
jgi:hypothetical protein